MFKPIRHSDMVDLSVWDDWSCQRVSFYFSITDLRPPWSYACGDGRGCAWIGISGDVSRGRFHASPLAARKIFVDHVRRDD